MLKTLRGKMTLMVSVVLVTTIGVMTAYSLVNSNQIFVRPIQGATTFVPELTQGQLPRVYVDEIGTDDVMTASLVTFDAVKAQKAFNTTQITVMVLIALCGIFLTYKLVGRALAPLDKLSATTAQIDVGKLNTRIETPRSKDEVAQLAHSFNAMLDRLNSSFELQKNFAQNAAHELKTPLAVLKTSMQVLGMEKEPSVEEYKENALIIEQSTDELIEIVEQLLTLTEKEDAQKQDIDINTIIADCISAQSSTADKIDVHMSTDLCDGAIYANPLLVKSVLGNIISNAVKYSKVGGEVLISTKSNNESIIITVSDTGIGIADDELESIFEPFYRADESRNKRVRGNGLGLSIVKAATDKLDGKINIMSTVGEGTSVEVALPL